MNAGVRPEDKEATASRAASQPLPAHYLSDLSSRRNTSTRHTRNRTASNARNSSDAQKYSSVQSAPNLYPIQPSPDISRYAKHLAGPQHSQTRANSTPGDPIPQNCAQPKIDPCFMFHLMRGDRWHPASSA